MKVPSVPCEEGQHTMFGYWAAIWVHLNRVSGRKRPNPFKGLVEAAKEKQKGE